MPIPQTRESTLRTPLRLWPGVLAVAVQWLLLFGLPLVAPEQGGTAVIAGVAGGFVVLLWWMFFSRAPWAERVGAIALMIVAVAASSRLVHESIAAGMMGFMLFIYGPPVMGLALVAWAAASRNLSSGARRASMVGAAVLGCVALMLVRTNGVTGDANSDFEWRWTPTAEERLLAQADEPVAIPPTPPAARAPESPSPSQPSDATTPPAVPAVGETPEKSGAPAREDSAGSAAPAANANVAWPGFRGPGRDSVIRGVRLETDWSRTPPVELWRRPIGPGWGSFAVAGDRIFTQEQRGDDEVVAAYSLKTGQPVWRHEDAARFWESNAGAGPRATPTFNNGRIYTLGGTGILNALDARDGSVIWSRNAAYDTGTTVPEWGISSSPLVVGDVVVVATGGTLAAYDVATGKPRWSGPADGWGYSSPHLTTIAGVAQIVLVNGPGAIGVNPSDGTVLWKHTWPGDSIVQPAVLAGGDLLLGSGSGLADKTGTTRVTVSLASGVWSVKERWMSAGLKPYFNDFVVHNGHAFGFDGSILASINLEDGRRAWKGGRYGHGQLVLLPEQDLLLVLSEEGELALVSATADKFTEIARVPAIEGKTWNHPVLVGDVLLVRNGQEMAAFRLPLAGR